PAGPGDPRLGGIPASDPGRPDDQVPGHLGGRFRAARADRRGGGRADDVDRRYHRDADDRADADARRHRRTQRLDREGPGWDDLQDLVEPPTIAATPWSRSSSSSRF